METIWAAVFMAFAGLTGLAFKQHPAYPRVANIVVALLGLAVVGGMIWDLAVAHAYREAIQFVELDKRHAAITAINASKIPFWTLPVVMVAVVYLKALEFLMPWLMGRKSDEKTDE